MPESEVLGLQGEPRAERRKKCPEKEPDHVEAPKMRRVISIVRGWY